MKRSELKQLIKEVRQELMETSLQSISDKLKDVGYNVTIPANSKTISVMGYGKGYFKAKKAKADSIVSDLNSKGFKATATKDIDGYYNIEVSA